MKAKSGVFVNENNELPILYFESGHIVELFEKFPEILFIYGTQDTNNVGRPLYCFMVEDGFG